MFCLRRDFFYVLALIYCRLRWGLLAYQLLLLKHAHAYTYIHSIYREANTLLTHTHTHTFYIIYKTLWRWCDYGGARRWLYIYGWMLQKKNYRNWSQRQKFLTSFFFLFLHNSHSFRWNHGFIYICFKWISLLYALRCVNEFATSM